MIVLLKDKRVIGATIKQARENKKLSQTELGNLVNVNQTTISRIETGRSAARICTLLAIFSEIGLELFCKSKTELYLPKRGILRHAISCPLIYLNLLISEYTIKPRQQQKQKVGADANSII